ncbi:MAG TPA: transporter substrate-binding domain-containing protein [Acetobacteraceae bacterium]|jgi:arginine/ornithine transport system substrate-binding protein|nr:transporter substrate-binding domain-containing protein [Acetobacteraceae bacterium]
MPAARPIISQRRYRHPRSWAAVLGMVAAVFSGGVPFARADHLKLGNEGIYPPFSIVDSSGKLTGIEPTWAHEMCKRMDADCEFMVMDFKALIPSLLEGKFDALVSQINPLPERKAKALFSIPIVYNPDSYVVPANSHYQFTKEGLKNVKLGEQRGGADLFYIQRVLGDSVPIVLYDNPDQIRLDLLAHRIDMTFGPKINWTLELINKPEGKDWKLDGGEYWVGDPSVPEPERGLSWIVRKGPAGEALIKRMNAALESMMKDCTFTKIREQYLQVPVLAAVEAPCLGKAP